MNTANQENLFHYNKNLKRFANTNRKNMTKAEACLWKFALSKNQMQGYQFRRQRPVLNYIADFMCKELMLIIEVDGLTHDWEEVAINDKKREEALKEIGFTVLRFEDEEVLCHINQVIYKIEEYIDWFKVSRENTIDLTTS
ncbi:MAG: endonuclease domain-containing protein [Sphingobacteriaceae bacterium]